MGGFKLYDNHPNINKLRKKILRNEPIYNGNNFLENSYLSNNKSTIFHNEIHYHPQRFDYEGSRYGDKTYNYYLNEPMKGDIKDIEWKFPRLYHNNSKHYYE